MAAPSGAPPRLDDAGISKRHRLGKVRVSCGAAAVNHRHVFEAGGVAGVSSRDRGASAARPGR